MRPPEQRDTSIVPRRTKERDSKRTPFLSILTGAHAGQIFELDRQRTKLGRHSDCHIVIDDEGVSRVHVLLLWLPDGAVELHDEHSTNGTFIGEERVKQRVLQDGDRIELGQDVRLRFGYADSEEIELARRLYEGANFDPLTRVLNRGSFMRRLEEELSLCQRQGGECSLILFDIDHFKGVNDTWGHPAGDAVLAGLATRVRGALRLEDVFGRLGGEEFGLLLRRMEMAGTLVVAEKLLESVRATTFAVPTPQGSQELTITVSLGVTAWTKGMDANALVATADEALYQAKSEGRNRCVVAPSRPSEP